MVGPGLCESFGLFLFVWAWDSDDGWDSRNEKARRRLRAEAGLVKGGVLLKSLRQPLEHECAEVLSSLFNLSSNGR